MGHSDEVDTVEAVELVLEQCAEQLGGETPRAALLFASTLYDHRVALDAVQARWPGLPLIGSSTDGEMSTRTGFTRDSLLLILLAGDGFEARVGLGRDLSKDPSAAVAAATACLGGDRAAVCLTTFAPSANSSAVLRDVQRALGEHGCPILGGLSADHREYARMVEFCGTEILTDSLPVLYLFGNIRTGWGIGSGWFPMGDVHRVTKSEGHIVHTIDGEPATAIFKHYWGEVPKDSLGEYPLAIYPDGEDKPWVLRAAMGSDPKTGSIRFAGDVPEGVAVRVTEILPEGLLSGALRSMDAAFASFPGDEPSLVLLFSCAARRWVLGTRAEDEFEQLSEALAARSQKVIELAGFYCYGEIAPFDRGSASAFHNETCVSVLLG
ncbi:MAG: FIST N-terminal domain-containing protein [Planctomycetota bacterium]